MSFLALGAAAAINCSYTLAQQGPSWAQQAPLTGPSARSHHAMVFDPMRQRAMMFGGAPTSQVPVDETWEWTPFQPTFPNPLQGSWALRNVSPKPAARSGHAMVWDSVRNVAVLFGGGGGSGILNDTWNWNGTVWSQQSPITFPTARYGHALAFDSARGVTVLFGGRDAASNALADTWEYDGVNWTQQFVQGFPAPRVGAAMSFDSTRGVSVLFGGVLGGGSSQADTWEYDGMSWTQRMPAATPWPRYGASMAFDSERDVTVLFGGTSGHAWSDTWEWDGSNWQQQISPLPGLIGRSDSSLVFDTNRNRMVLFGGDTYGVKLSDTWEYFVAAGYTPFGTGCPGSAGYATLGQGFVVPALLGSALVSEIHNLPNAAIAVMVMGFSKTAWNGAPLPASLAAIGMPGCDLLVRPDLLDPMPINGNSATYLVQLPSDPSFLGYEIHQQGLVFDAAAGNAFGAIMTNAATAVIGH